MLDNTVTQEFLRLKELGKKYYDEKSLKDLARNGTIDISDRLEEIKKISNMREIIIALDGVKTDILCIVRQKYMNEDVEYKEQMEKALKAFQDVQIPI